MCIDLSLCLKGSRRSFCKVFTASAVGIVAASETAAAVAAAVDIANAVTTAAVIPKSLFFLDSTTGNLSSGMETGIGTWVGIRIITASLKAVTFQHWER